MPTQKKSMDTQQQHSPKYNSTQFLQVKRNESQGRASALATLVPESRSQSVMHQENPQQSQTLQTLSHIDIKQQLEGMISHNYSNSRHFFNFITQELCYTDYRTKSQPRQRDSNTKNVPMAQTLPTIVKGGQTLPLKKSNHASSVGIRRISIVPQKKGPQSKLFVDQDTINRSVYQEHEDFPDDYNQQMNRMLQESDVNSEKSDDEANLERIGVPSVNKYFTNYHNLKRSLERSKHKRQATVAYIKKCENLKLIPQPMGLVRLKGRNDSLNATFYNMGNKYATALGKGIKLSPVKHLNLASNRLDTSGAVNVIKGLTFQVKQLDLSNNNICLDIRGIEQLCRIISDRRYQLETLILDSNRLSDQHIQMICEALISSSNKTLKTLSLGENLISDIGAQHLAEMLELNTTRIKHLNLSWNNIKSKGGITLANALRSNTELKSLDLAWNSLGSYTGVQVNQTQLGFYRTPNLPGKQPPPQPKIEIGSVWGNVFADNKSLIHLDLSFNKISYQDTEIFSYKLKKNHALIGLHYQGNDGNVDSLGFLRATPQSNESPSALLFKTKRRSISTNANATMSRFRNRDESQQDFLNLSNFENQSKDFEDPVAGNCCWLCEGWKEVYFNRLDLYALRPEAEINAQLLPPNQQLQVFVHFDFDNWEPDLLVDASRENPDQKGKFQNYRMVPKGINYFFYSYNGEAFYNPNEDFIKLDEFQRQAIKQKLSESKRTNPHQKIENFDLDCVNIISVAHNLNDNEDISSLDDRAKEIYEIYQVLIRNCIPRDGKEYKPKNQTITKAKWSVDKSLFKDYPKEIFDDYVIPCFEFDWSCMKPMKWKKSTETEIKDIMRSTYRLIKDCYKVQAGLGVIGSVFSVALNQYTDFVKEQLKLIDGQYLNQADSDRIFITVNAYKKGPLIPANALVRFQFMEILMRLALKKFFESGIVQTEAQALSKMIKEHLLPGTAEQLTAHEWRAKYLWHEAVDNCLKAYHQLFFHIYNTFGGKSRKPGQKMFMTAQEFDEFVQCVPFVNDLFVQRDVLLCYNLAMMCQINEIDNERHLQANYIEFLEAFCRVAEKASFPPYQEIQSYDDIENQIVMPVADRVKQPLHEKIENVIPYLLQNCATRQFVEKEYKKPSKDPLVGLYVLTNGKYFQTTLIIVYQL